MKDDVWAVADESLEGGEEQIEDHSTDLPGVHAVAVTKCSRGGDSTPLLIE